MSPIYAGVYVYGRRCHNAGRRGHSARSNPSRDQDDWQVLIKNRLPAYIGWDRFEENQAQLRANQAQHVGIPRGGPSLLAGLLICGHCGYRMATCYRTNGRDLRYQCLRGNVSKGDNLCQSISGSAIDPLIERLLLAALKPSALEVSLALAEDIELERTRDRRRQALRLEQVEYEAERAERQFNAVEPENRLVARTLEKRWEEALGERDRLLAERTREEARTPVPLSREEKEAIRALAENIPALWRAATTMPAERKEIARLLLERVILTVQGKSEKATLVCVWAGGRETTHAFIRPVRWTDQLTRGAELRKAVADLAKAGLGPVAIARQLTQSGWLSVDAQPFDGAKVYAIMARMGLAQPLYPPTSEVERRAGEMTVLELSSVLDQPIGTLYAWIRKGWLPTRRAQTSSRDVLLVRLEDARSIVAKRNDVRNRSQEWKTPTPKRD